MESIVNVVFVGDTYKLNMGNKSLSTRAIIRIYQSFYVRRFQSFYVRRFMPLAVLRENGTNSPWGCSG